MRTAGIAFFSLIPLIFGVFRTIERKKEKDLAAALSSFFHQFFQAIDRRLDTQTVFLDSFSDPFLEKTGFLTRYREEIRENPAGALDRSFRTYFASRGTGAIRKAVLSFTADFGMLSKSAQMRSFEKLFADLDPLYETAKENADKSRKTDLPTGLFLSLAIWILWI